jgi:hypothetical protein
MHATRNNGLPCVRGHGQLPATAHASRADDTRMTRHAALARPLRRTFTAEVGAAAGVSSSMASLATASPPPSATAGARQHPARAQATRPPRTHTRDGESEQPAEGQPLRGCCGPHQTGPPPPRPRQPAPPPAPPPAHRRRANSKTPRLLLWPAARRASTCAPPAATCEHGGTWRAQLQARQAAPAPWRPCGPCRRPPDRGPRPARALEPRWRPAGARKSACVR